MAATLNPALRDFWTTPARNRVLYGGRMSSKSWDAAGFAIFLASNYKVRFLCTRQFQNKIAESVYTLLKIQAERFGMAAQFKFTESSVIHRTTGSEFVFYGIARNIDEIKSTESIDIGWHEECHLMTAAQWEIINPTLRGDGSQHWLIFNPRYANDFVYQNFVANPPDKTVVKLINYVDNPFLSQTALDLIEDEKKRDPEGFENIYLGVPKVDTEGSVIKMSWIEAAVDAHIKLGFAPEGEKRIGFDVADDGADKCANVYTHGSVALWCDEWKGGEDKLMQSCSRTYNNALERSASIRYDCIGVGAGCGSKFDELNQARGLRLKYSKFNAGDSVFQPDAYYLQSIGQRITNRDHFSNLKSQSWWLIADRFRNTYDAINNGTKYAQDELISISSDMPMLAKLKAELSTPKRDFDANGKVKVESKKDLARRDVPSPNLADAFVICFAPATKAMIISADALNLAGRV